MESNSDIIKNPVGNPNFYKGMPSLNPAGRPRASASFKDIISWAMQQLVKDGDEYKTQKQIIIEQVTEQARRGKPWAIEWLADRLEGKAVQTVIEQKKNPLGELTDEQLDEVLSFLKAKKINAPNTDL